MTTCTHLDTVTVTELPKSGAAGSSLLRACGHLERDVSA
jgi:hypothetical protein